MTDECFLLIDAGNTRIKWAWLDAAGLGEMHSLAHGERDISLQIAAQNITCVPTRMIVSNVAGKVFADRLSTQLQARWPTQVEFIVPQMTAFGISTAYAEPARLGADRWAALLGARHDCHAALCVVDCGSAITIDTLDAEGHHLGGLILPGLAMLRRALRADTQGLADIRSAPAIDMQPFARDTAQAVASGTLYAAVAAIDRAMQDIHATLPVNQLYLSGGDAARLQPLLAHTYLHQPDLVLQGLAVIARTTA